MATWKYVAYFIIGKTCCKKIYDRTLYSNFSFHLLPSTILYNNMISHNTTYWTYGKNNKENKSRVISKTTQIPYLEKQSSNSSLVLIQKWPSGYFFVRDSKILSLFIETLNHATFSLELLSSLFFHLKLLSSLIFHFFKTIKFTAFSFKTVNFATFSFETVKFPIFFIQNCQISHFFIRNRQGFDFYSKLSSLPLFYLKLSTSVLFHFFKGGELASFSFKKSTLPLSFKNCPVWHPLFKNVEFTTFSFETVILATFSFKTVEFTTLFQFKSGGKYQISHFLIKTI